MTIIELLRSSNVLKKTVGKKKRKLRLKIAITSPKIVFANNK